ncbi:hypothetical protein [Desulfurispira natronophila]|uniref:Uncharacterized protein n=1 Tax=Desulfurispira natronophila TaxID=682562 RepID=A0A7W8DG38_9BACT|nr:hypothetical protein [Desulfurispira natronophila]MBB5021017.1 hypothetical protein [Desulfurispira natronophila]
MIILALSYRNSSLINGHMVKQAALRSSEAKLRNYTAHKRKTTPLGGQFKKNVLIIQSIKIAQTGTTKAKMPDCFMTIRANYLIAQY